MADAPNRFIFNGISSLDMGLYVEKVPSRRSPEKDLTTYKVAGRSEPLHIWDGSWKPYTVKYRCWFQGNPPEKQLHEINEWLHGAPVKSRLEDSYDTTVFRYATYKGGADAEMLMRQIGKFVIEFEVGAQAFLKSAESALEFTRSGGLLNNPSPFITKPLVRLVGTIGGALQVGGSSMLVMFPDMERHEIWVDCEEQEAWEIVDGAEVSTNAYIGGQEYLEIRPGTNTVEFPSSFELVQVYTRAYTL